MRPSLTAENLLEQIALWSGLLPKPIFQGLYGLGFQQILVTAVELQIFDALEHQSATTEALANKLSYDRRGLETLLQALNGMDLLRHRAGVYSLRPVAKRYLLTDAPESLVDVVHFMRVLDAKLSQMARTIRSGERADFHEHLSTEEWRSYIRGLGTMAGLMSKAVVRKVPLYQPQTLLDVAGGHGMYSAAFCQRYPQLTAKILDLPQAIAIGSEMLQQKGIAQRISFEAGDLLYTDWGGTYDAVLLFNILHNLPKREAQETLHKARAALKPQGTLVIFDGRDVGGQGDLSYSAGFGKLFFYLFSNSEPWPEPILRTWLNTAGFTKIKSHRILPMPDMLLLCAT
jgi:ubiquinone/menaquinone biosynthesis C-methylase UbiE